MRMGLLGLVVQVGPFLVSGKGYGLYLSCKEYFMISRKELRGGGA